MASRLKASKQKAKTKMHKNVYIKTYGCQMNVYDSNAMEQLLFENGWRAQSQPEMADLIILNTCNIRAKAAEKIYSEIGRMKKFKTKANRKMIAVAGCVAQAEGKAMITRQPEIDFVFGPQSFHQLPKMIEAAQKGRKTIADDFLTTEKFSALKFVNARARANKKISAFLTIQEGCDKFCSFCVVPFTRGQEVSRSPQDIIIEAKKLANDGVREIILLGQNVNAYQCQGFGLAELLAELANIPKILRLRYTTSHPLDMNEKLILAHKHNEKLMPQLHLPVQSGSDIILKKMLRRHTKQYYYDIIASLKEARADIAISSDFIVGFANESEEDFQQTVELIKDIGFANAYSFKFSPRPGTKAADEKLPEDKITSKKLTELKNLLSAQSLEFNQSKVGSVLEILLERNNFGKTPYGQNTYLLNPKEDVGEIAQVKITSASSHGLEGEIV